jgi:hypothetical protein
MVITARLPYRGILAADRTFLTGPNWPQNGEIDIVEGVNDYTNNQATVHTNPGCTLSSQDSNALGISGNVVGGTNCAALETGNQGCGVRSKDTNSFGPTFNQNGGGVYSSEFTTLPASFPTLLTDILSAMG